MNEIFNVLENYQAVITLAVLILAICLFVSSALAPELTGLLSVALLIGTGVLSPQKALAGFGSPALITLMGLFAVSAALFKSGALDRLRELIASESIRTPRRLIALLGLVVAPVSGVVPNTPVVASLLPVVEGWCMKRKLSPSRVLLPLSRELGRGCPFRRAATRRLGSGDKPAYRLRRRAAVQCPVPDPDARGRVA